jgi:hypothetical protein
MKRFTLLFIFLTLWAIYLPAQTIRQGMLAKDSAWNVDVKSVFLELNSTSLERPYLKLGSSDKLMLRFDVLGSQPQSFRYRIHHCDADWHVDDAQAFDFIHGFDENSVDNYQNSFTTMQNYVNYYQSLPSEYTEFTHSGNYLLEVFMQDEPDSVILTKRFCVYEDLMDVQVSVDKPMSGVGDAQRDQEANVGITFHQGVFIPSPTTTLTVKVQQNQRIDAVHTLKFSGYDGPQMLYRWQEANVFHGGNCFRYFDCSNLRTATYNIAEIERYGGENFAILTPLEDRSHSVYIYEQTLNGGMKINVWDRDNKETESDYVEVSFTLPMKKPFLSGNIYIIGDITNWDFNEDSRMEWRPEYNAYFKRIQVKQGYYAYQLLVLPVGEKEGSTAYLEGDHYETPNDYTVYVYQHQPGDRYDRLVGLKVLK